MPRLAFFFFLSNFHSYSRFLLNFSPLFKNLIFPQTQSDPISTNFLIQSLIMNRRWPSHSLEKVFQYSSFCIVYKQPTVMYPVLILSFITYLGPVVLGLRFSPGSLTRSWIFFQKQAALSLIVIHKPWPLSWRSVHLLTASASAQILNAWLEVEVSCFVPYHSAHLLAQLLKKGRVVLTHDIHVFPPRSLPIYLISKAP